ncbi:MAG: DinB family protein [Dehalococcoidia bacterium]
MAEDREALLAHFRQMRAEFEEAIAGLSEEQLAERSHNGWSVKDHMAHIAFWDEVRAAEVERISAGLESAWRLSPEEDQQLNDMVTRARWHLSLAQVRREFDETKRGFLEVLARATPEGLDASRYGEAGLTSGHEAEHAGWIREWRAERGY